MAIVVEPGPSPGRALEEDRTMVERSDQIKKALRGSGVVVKPPGLFVGTGSTMLNLACTGRADDGFACGHYYLFVGDSDSGKTFFSMTCFSEAAKNPEFDDYRLIYNGPEGGALMDVARFFGKRVARRLEPPATVNGEPRHSRTAQEFYYHVDDAFSRGRPFIMVLDSQDSLSSEEEIKKFDKTKKASRRSRRDEKEEAKGSYGDSKAKIHSANLRRVLGPLEETGSILIIINQTRDSFDPFVPSTYSGGRALKFYATLQLWSSQAGKINREVKGKERELGIRCKIRIKKNRVTGRDRTVVVPIYHSVGIDDTGSMVDYLVSEKVWKCSEGVITVEGLGPTFLMKSEKLIQYIEEKELVDDMKALVVDAWESVEKACEVTRKNRYS